MSEKLIKCTHCGVTNRINTSLVKEKIKCGKCKEELIMKTDFSEKESRISDHPVSINDKNFKEEVLDYKGLVLVDFWADWCFPCKMIAPTIETINKEMSGKVKVVKLNVDLAPMTANKYQIRSIPTLMLFKDGKVFKQISGALNKGQLIEWMGLAA